jgi:glycosyltransferase involved in cell wall biosynthesis
VSLSVLSAAAAGKPCLDTTAADPLGTLARAGAAITVETSVASIGAGLRRAAALPDRELQAMGERGRRAVQATFSWSSLAAALAAECREKLADRPSS